MSEDAPERFQEEPPPIFPSWNYWYALVLGTLTAFILIFYFFATR